MTAPLGPDRVSIRPATDDDTATLVEFRLAMMADVFGSGAGAPEVEPGAMREANRRWMGEHLGRDFVAWIADLDGRPVAGAGLLWFAHPPSPSNPGGREAYILNVYTGPEARHKGLARALMARLVEEAKAAGVRRIWLRASADGRPLYEAMGFRATNYLELKQD
jgi:GNAT superfamily N-acetyltransferase